MKKLLLAIAVMISGVLSATAGNLYVTNNSTCNVNISADNYATGCPLGYGGASPGIIAVDIYAGMSTTYSGPGYWAHAAVTQFHTGGGCPLTGVPAPGCPKDFIDVWAPCSRVGPSSDCITQISNCNSCPAGTPVNATWTDLGGGDASLVFN